MRLMNMQKPSPASHTIARIFCLVEELLTLKYDRPRQGYKNGDLEDKMGRRDEGEGHQDYGMDQFQVVGECY
jgi:hypothetical protein